MTNWFCITITNKYSYWEMAFSVDSPVISIHWFKRIYFTFSHGSLKYGNDGQAENSLMTIQHCWQQLKDADMCRRILNITEVTKQSKNLKQADQVWQMSVSDASWQVLNITDSEVTWWQTECTTCCPAINVPFSNQLSAQAQSSLHTQLHTLHDEQSARIVDTV